MKENAFPHSISNYVSVFLCAPTTILETESTGFLNNLVLFLVMQCVDQMGYLS